MNENEQRQVQVPGGQAAGEKKKKRGGEFDEAWQPQLWSKLIILVLIVGYGIALVVANTDKVPISFLVTEIDVSMIWLILVCFVIGLVSGVLISQMYRHRKLVRTKAKLAGKTKKA